MTMHRHNLLPAAAALLLLLPGLSGAATITVYADRNPAVLQESFQLIFETSGELDGDPDFSPLERDFQVLATSTSTSMSIVNTKITSTRQWRLTLMPLRAGELDVPTISFGKDQSPPATLTVAAARSGAAGPGSAEIFLEVTAAPAPVHVQEQVVYTVTLYRALSTTNETLSEPVVNQGNAIIELLDADRSYDTFIQGRPYSVFERRYAIYPQVSGNLLVEPVRFQAQLATGSGFSLDPFNAGAGTVVRQSEPLELQVMPAPADYQGQHWLPAGDVKIIEEWSRAPNELAPDEPVTRSLTLTAEGLTASQLPALPELLPAGFKQYPAQPELQNAKDADGITGTRQQKNALIPTQAGEYTLPALSLAWWNTETRSLAYATLPERQIKVRPAAPATGIDAPALPAPAGDAQVQSQATPATGSGATPTGPFSPGLSVWQWLTGILAVAWLATLAYALKNRKGADVKSPPAQAENVKQARKALERACRDNDPEQAKTALLQWARARPHGPPASSLGDLEQQARPGLAAEIQNLSRRLYSRAAEPWHGAPLWQAFLQEYKHAAADTPTPVAGKLEPLFRL